MWLSCTTLYYTSLSKSKIKKIEMKTKMKINENGKIKWKRKKIKWNQVYYLQLWHYPFFKVSPAEKLSLTFLPFCLISL